MAGEPLPPVENPRRSLVIWWSPDTMEVELDRGALSWFDVQGVCQAALDITETHLPCPVHAEEEEGAIDDE